MSDRRTTRASAAAAIQQRTVVEDASERNEESYNQFETSVFNLPNDDGSQHRSANTENNYVALGFNDATDIVVAPPAPVGENVHATLEEAVVGHEEAMETPERHTEGLVNSGKNSEARLGDSRDNAIQVPLNRSESDETHEGPRLTSIPGNAGAQPPKTSPKRANAHLSTFLKVHGSKQSQTAEARQTREDVEFLVDEGIAHKAGVVQFGARGPVNQGGTLLRKHAIVSSMTKALRERDEQSGTPENETSPLDRFNKPSKKASAATQALIEAISAGDSQLQVAPPAALAAHRTKQQPREIEQKKALTTPNPKPASSEQAYFEHVASKKRPAENDELTIQRQTKRRRTSATTGDTGGNDVCHTSKPSRRVSSTFVDRQGSPNAVAVFGQQQTVMASIEKASQERLEELSNLMDLDEDTTMLSEDEDVEVAESPAPFQPNKKLTPDEPKAPSAVFTLADEAYVKKLGIMETKNNELFNPFKTKRQPSDTPFLNGLKEKVKGVKAQKASPPAKGAVSGSGQTRDFEQFEDFDKTIVEEAEQQRPIDSRRQVRNAARNTTRQSSSSSTSRSNSLTWNAQEQARQEQVEWEASLDPFRRTIFDAILHIARRVVDGLGSPQAAVRATVEDFERGGQALKQACFREWNETYTQFGLGLDRVMHTVGDAFVAWEERHNASEGYKDPEEQFGLHSSKGQEADGLMALWRPTEEVAKAAIEELVREGDL